MKFIIYSGKLNTTELAIQTIMEMTDTIHSIPSVKHMYQNDSDITYVALDEFLQKYSGTVYLPFLIKDSKNILPVYGGRIDIKSIIKYCKVVDITDDKINNVDIDILNKEYNSYRNSDNNFCITSLGSIKYNYFIIGTKEPFRSAIIISNSNMKGIGDYKNSNIQLWESLYDFCKMLSIRRMLLIIDNDIYPYQNKYLIRLNDAYEYIIEDGVYYSDPLIDLYQLYLPDGIKFVNGRIYRCKICKKWMALTVNNHRNNMSKNWLNPTTCRECREYIISNKF